MYAILPVKTGVKNVGNDGSGTHVSKSDKRFDNEIDMSVKEAVFENVELDERIYKEFVKVLYQLSLENDCCIEFIVLWNTTQKSEISEYNTRPNNVIQINNDSNLYSLIYALENNSILPSTAYVIRV